MLINSRNASSATPLHVASRKGSLDLTRLLIDHGADVNCHGGRQGSSPLHEASKTGHLDVAQLLLGHGDAMDRMHAFYALALCMG